MQPRKDSTFEGRPQEDFSDLFDEGRELDSKEVPDGVDFFGELSEQRSRVANLRMHTLKEKQESATLKPCTFRGMRKGVSPYTSCLTSFCQIVGDW